VNWWPWGQQPGWEQQPGEDANEVHTMHLMNNGHLSRGSSGYWFNFSKNKIEEF
jgi:hypothetical protein